jgi:ABC-type uncharacterized transport system involved in gliding motility auxiliary subunit
MQINPKIKRRLFFQNTSFIILFLVAIGLLAWLSIRYEFQADWTDNQRNTASNLLATMDAPLKIRAFVSEANTSVRQEVKRLVALYRRHKADIQLIFIDPITEPGLVRELGISIDGELVIEYQQRQHHLQTLSEQDLSNVLQQLIRSGRGLVVFVSGHDERKINDQSSTGYLNFAQQLSNKGLQLATVNLTIAGEIPERTEVLVMADPRANYLDGELELVMNYVNQGGNLLWLSEPEPSVSPDVLAEELGIEFLPGLIVDLNTQLLGIDDPRFALVAEYSLHPITEGFDVLTLFPESRGLEFNGDELWDADHLLMTLPRSWAETDELSEETRFDIGLDIQGPITLGLALSRIQDSSNTLEQVDSEDISELDNEDARHQRVIVIGDADFLSNAYLGQGGNLDLGLNIINWLKQDDQLINIPAKTRTDGNITLSSMQQGLIGGSFLIFIPGLLLGCGIVIWLRRRKG